MEIWYIILHTLQYTIYDQDQGDSGLEKNSIETGWAYLAARGNHGSGSRPM